MVRSGSSLSLHDLSRVSFDRAQAVVVLVNDADVDEPNKADGRIIKTLLALYNHPDLKGNTDKLRVTAEVMLAQNQEIAMIASGGRANVIKTNEIISRIILQTSRISGLSIVYDNLLRFEGAEFHVKQVPVFGRRFGELLLDFPNGLLVGVAKVNGSGHLLNPPADHVVQQDEALVLLAEDANIQFQPYQGPLNLGNVSVPPGQAQKAVEHMLVLGWNSKVFPILEEFDNYVGPGSTLTLVNALPRRSRRGSWPRSARRPGTPPSGTWSASSQPLADGAPAAAELPDGDVLGDASGGGGVEESDTRAIIALLLLRDFRRRSGFQPGGVQRDPRPKNRELAATTEIRDVVISNEMVSMVLAQITYEPRIRTIPRISSPRTAARSTSRTSPATPRSVNP